MEEVGKPRDSNRFLQSNYNDAINQMKNRLLSLFQFPHNNEIDGTIQDKFEYK